MKLSEIPYDELESIIQVCRELDEDLDVSHEQLGVITIKCRESLKAPYLDGDPTPFKKAFHVIAKSFPEEITELDTSGQYSNSRLLGSICFGESNGEPLFIDSRTGNICIWYHDGADVSVIDQDFQRFLHKCNDL